MLFKLFINLILNMILNTYGMIHQQAFDLKDFFWLLLINIHKRFHYKLPKQNLVFHLEYQNYPPDQLHLVLSVLNYFLTKTV